MKAVEPAPYETTTDLTDRGIGTRSRSRAVWILLTIGVVILGFGLIVAGLSRAGTDDASAILVPIVVDSTDDAAEAVTVVPETTRSPTATSFSATPRRSGGPSCRRS